MHNILLILVAALVTMSTRFLPFLVFGKNRPIPRIVTYLGSVLPFAVMGMLVVYCMKDVVFLAPPYGIPELLSCLVVAALHLWKRSSLLSIGVGTVFYMVLIQVVF